MTSGSGGADPAAALRARIVDRRPVTWVGAGDSVVQGARWTDGARDYLQLLEERVRYELGRDGDVFARTAMSGWRIGDVARTLDRVERIRPDVVLVGVGVNDAKLGPARRAEFTQTYEAVIERLRDRGAFIVLMAPNAVGPDAHPVLVDQLAGYVDDIRALARRLEVALVDNYALWAGDGGFAPHGWLADPEHPNALGHRMLARALFDTLGVWDPDSKCCRIVDDRSARGI